MSKTTTLYLSSSRADIVTYSDVEYLYKPLAFCYLRKRSDQGDRYMQGVLKQAVYSLTNASADNTDYIAYQASKARQAILSNNDLSDGEKQALCENIVTRDKALQDTVNVLTASVDALELELSIKRPKANILKRLIELAQCKVDLLLYPSSFTYNKDLNNDKSKLVKRIERKTNNLVSSDCYKHIKDVLTNEQYAFVFKQRDNVMVWYSYIEYLTAYYKPLYQRCELLKDTIHIDKVDIADIEYNNFDKYTSDRYLKASDTDFDMYVNQAYVELCDMFIDIDIITFKDCIWNLYARLDKTGYGANRRDTRKRVYELRYAENGDTRTLSIDDIFNAVRDTKSDIDYLTYLSDFESLMRDFQQVLTGLQYDVYMACLNDYCSHNSLDLGRVAILIYGENTADNVNKVYQLKHKYTKKWKKFIKERQADLAQNAIADKPLYTVTFTDIINA